MVVRVAGKHDKKVSRGAKHTVKEIGDLMYSIYIARSFISGNARLFDVLPCRHFKWDVAEVGILD